VLLALSQKALASHSVSLLHVVGHTGGLWSIWPLQKTGKKNPQSLATVVNPQAESFCSVPVVAQVFPAVQTAAPMEPWQVLGSSQTGSKLPKLGQSLACWQQSPNSQQKVFWQ